MAIIDPDEVLDLGTGAIEAADVVAAAGLRAQRVIDEVAADLPGTVAPDSARTFALIAAELAEQGMVAKTRAEDLLANERPLAGLADLVGVDYWTPAPRDSAHPLAHEFVETDVALPEALVERYLPTHAAGAHADIDPASTTPAAGRWSVLPPLRLDDPPVSAGWRGARAGERIGGSGAELNTGVDTVVAAAAGGLAGIALGLTSAVMSDGFDTI